MMDGNFKLINLGKNNDLSDKSLWNGRGYFRKQMEFNAHMQEHRNLKGEVRRIFPVSCGRNRVDCQIERKLSQIQRDRELEYFKV